MSRLTLPLLAFAFLAACGQADDLADRRSRTRGGENGDVQPEALLCNDPKAGRSYVNFDGEKLEAKRLDEGGSVNRARFKPFGVMAGEYQRVLGNTPASLAGAEAAFGAAPARWFAEQPLSGTALNATFSVSFDACLEHTKGDAFAAAPTDDTAKEFCSTTIRKAWSRAGSPEEIGACVELATKKLDAEADAHRRWSYVCASIMSSSNFLTY